MPLSITESEALSICASPAFAKRLAAGSPYRDFGELVDAAQRIWWREIGPGEWLAAFDAHPKIGETAHRDHSAAFAAFSHSEQVSGLCWLLLWVSGEVAASTHAGGRSSVSDGRRGRRAPTLE